jgi:hypothetical protein
MLCEAYMAKKLILGGSEYDLSKLTEVSKTKLSALTFVDEKIKELNDNKSLLIRAKNSYLESLKQEILSNKSGFLFKDN